MKRLLFAVALLALTLTLPQAASAQMMKPPNPMTRSQFEGASAGEAVQLVVRVVSRRRDELQAEFLERITDRTYKATGSMLHLYYPDDTPVIMGSSSDVTKGAILFVYGVATGKDRADVKNVTVVSKFVNVR